MELTKNEASRALPLLQPGKERLRDHREFKKRTSYLGVENTPGAN